MWRNWDSCSLLAGIQMVWLPWKRVWRFLKQLKRIVIRSTDATSGYTPKRMESRVLGRYICTPMFTATYAQRQKGGSSPHVHRQIRDTQIVVYIQWDMPQPEKGGMSDTCYNADETWGHHAKETSLYKRTSTVWSHLYEAPRGLKSLATRGRMVGARGWVKHNVETEFRFCKMQRVLDGGDSRTAMWMYLTWLNCTL